MAALPKGVLESALNLEDRAHDDALVSDLAERVAEQQRVTAPPPPTPQWSLPSLDSLLGTGGTRQAPETPQQQAVPTQQPWQEQRTPGWQLPSLDVLLGRDPNARPEPAQMAQQQAPLAASGASAAMPTAAQDGQAVQAPPARPAATGGNHGEIDNSSRQAFIRTAYPYMLEAAGGDQNLAELMLAKAISENGSIGTGRPIWANNVSGIKGEGDAGSIEADTWEDYGNGPVNIRDRFAAYSTPQAGFRAFMQFLHDNSRYAPALARYQQTRDASQLFRDILAAGYATDKAWADKVESIRANQVAPIVRGQSNQDMPRLSLNAGAAPAPATPPPAPGAVSSAAPGAPPAPWEMPGANDGGQQAFMKAGGDDEYDPRLYDEGPREAAPTPVNDAMLPGDGGTAPTPEYDPRQYDEGPREYRPPAPVYADPTIADPAYSEQRQPDPIMGPEQPEASYLEQATDWVQRTAAPLVNAATNVYGREIAEGNRVQDEIDAVLDAKSNEFANMVRAPIDDVRRGVNIANRVLMATPQATADVVNAALERFGLGRDALGVDLPLVGRVGIADFIDLGPVSNIGMGRTGMVQRPAQSIIPNVGGAIEDVAGAGIRAAREGIRTGAEAVGRGLQGVGREVAGGLMDLNPAMTPRIIGDGPGIGRSLPGPDDGPIKYPSSTPIGSGSASNAAGAANPSSTGRPRSYTQDEWEDADRRWDDAMRRHGEDSPQAKAVRAEMDRMQASDDAAYDWDHDWDRIAREEREAARPPAEWQSPRPHELTREQYIGKPDIEEELPWRGAESMVRDLRALGVGLDELEPITDVATIARGGRVERYAMAVDPTNPRHVVLLHRPETPDGRPLYDGWDWVGEYSAGGTQFGIEAAHRGRGLGPRFLLAAQEYLKDASPGFGYSRAGFINRQRAHRLAVEQALARGENVPENVLAEYPDLAPRPQGRPAPSQRVVPAPDPLLPVQRAPGGPVPEGGALPWPEELRNAAREVRAILARAGASGGRLDAADMARLDALTAELADGSRLLGAASPVERVQATTARIRELSDMLADVEADLLRAREAGDSAGVGRLTRARERVRAAYDNAQQEQAAAYRALDELDNRAEGQGYGSRTRSEGDLARPVFEREREVAGGTIPTTRDDTPRSPGLNSAIPGFDPGAAAMGGAAGAMSEGEDGEAGDPLRTLAGMGVAGVAGRMGRRRGVRATVREAADLAEKARLAKTNPGGVQAAMEGFGPPSDILKMFQERYSDPRKAERAALEYQRMLEDSASEEQIANFLRSAQDGRLLDRFNTIRYASMLSDPKTHGQNSIGSLVMGALDMANTPFAVLADVIRSRATGAPRETFMSEIPARLAGWGASAGQGLRDAAFIMRNGLRPQDVTKLDQPNRGFATNIPGLAPAGSRAADTVDAAMELPMRALAAADAFWRGTFTGGHLAAEAIARATRNNAGKPPSAEQIAKAMLDPDVIARADAMAARSVLQESRHAAEGLNTYIQGLPDAAQAVVSTVIPYIRTPFNIVAQGVGMTPLGLISLAQDIRAGKPTREINQRVGRLALGTMAMGWAGWQNMQGNLTGPYPENEAERSTLPPGWRPWSYKVTAPGVGTQYVPIGVFGPVAVPMVASILMTEGAKRGQKFDLDRAAKVAQGIGQFAEDQTFLRSLADLSEAFEKGGNTMMNYVERLSTQASPHVVGGGGVGRRIQEILGMPQRDPDGIIEALAATHPAFAGLVPPKRDVLGRQQQSGPSGLLAAQPFVRSSEEKDAPVLRAYRQAKVSLPRGAPKDYDPGDGSGRRPLSRRQRESWKVAYGQALQSEWSNAGSPSDPAELRRITETARERALSTVTGR